MLLVYHLYGTSEYPIIIPSQTPVCGHVCCKHVNVPKWHHPRKTLIHRRYPTENLLEVIVYTYKSNNDKATVLTQSCCGIRQGYILSPVVFIAYIKDYCVKFPYQYHIMCRKTAYLLILTLRITYSTIPRHVLIINYHSKTRNTRDGR